MPTPARLAENWDQWPTQSDGRTNASSLPLAQCASTKTPNSCEAISLDIWLPLAVWREAVTAMRAWEFHEQPL
eukprot:3537010-Pyramimonas_sp.AAC.1